MNLRRFFYRKPDFIIGLPEDPYLLRWWIIPRNRYLNIYLHKFLRSDDDRANHDHPWASCSIILKGGYLEHVPGKIHVRDPGRVVFRRADQAHRIELYENTDYGMYFFGTEKFRRKERPAWTLFITGPKVREWGFHCKQGWKHWRDFCGVPEGEARGGETGKGCED